ncbi:Pyruvate:ferredoxin oxidoreductase, partial [Aduncisulcus paluster]
MPSFDTLDGCTAAARIAYFLSDMSIIYPITPSSPMAASVDSYSAAGKLNAWGQKVDVTEMQSEAGAAGAVHGALIAGGLTSTFTASQGLLLMIPNLYKMVGEHLPGVFHVAARSIARHALSIFGDHSDIMAARDTGVAMLIARTVQEAQDMALAAHLLAIKAHHPVMSIQDGFRTSHSVSKIELIDFDKIRPYIDKEAIHAYKAKCLNPDHPQTMAIERVFDDVYAITGRGYDLFSYVGHKDAKYVTVVMGSGGAVIEEYIRHVMKTNPDERIGLIRVHVYRPFSAKHLDDALPKTCEVVCALDRTKSPGDVGEPLYQEIISSLHIRQRLSPLPEKLEKGYFPVKVIGGRFGLSSREFTPAMVHAVYKNMKFERRSPFTVGI